MPALASMAATFGYGRPRRAAAPSGQGGSLSFAGTASSNLSVANDADFRFGTGDFTIEWFQYMNTGQSFPRIFSMGSYPSATIAVSIEGTSFYFWIGGGANLIASLSNYTNQWVHFAISRSGTTVRVFQNGTQIGSNLTSSYNFNDTTNVLRIGNEGSTSTGAAYKGNLTNFRWVKGTAVYTSNFTRPAAPLTAVTNTKLLLLADTSGTATTDSSGLGKTVTNNSVTWVTADPFGGT